MKLIDKYIYKELTLPIIFGISLFSFIFLIDILVSMMENILVKSVPVLDVLELLSYTLPPIFAETIPMGVFLGIMITFSSLSTTSEIIAMESIGISLKRIIKPTLLLAFIIMCFVYFLHQSVIPRSGEKLIKISRKIAYTKPSVQLEEKIFITGINDYNVYINHLEPSGTIADSLIVFKKETDTIYPQVILAKKAKWENSKMYLEDANFYKVNSEGKLALKGDFEKQEIPIDTFFGDFNTTVEKPENMSITELFKKVKYLKQENKKTIKYELEMYKKLYIPSSILILSVLGVILSVNNNRSGKGASFGISIFIIFIYITLINIFYMISQKGNIKPSIAMIIPNMLLLLFTLFLYVRKARSR
ncbi:MAG: lipopolysaccharide export system permease protein [Fusobacteriaceae bacterium]|jgi:lipopolysaccharide export system permease protein|nr:permease YjgP/YjgQ family protein [Fusobacteriales bacterium]MDN5303523.1 lipopolysaccharide export system permease protein [Fusobacteriaceae bacterium]